MNVKKNKVEHMLFNVPIFMEVSNLLTLELLVKPLKLTFDLPVADLDHAKIMVSDLENWTNLGRRVHVKHCSWSQHLHEQN